MSGFLDFSSVTVNDAAGVSLPLGVFPGRVQSTESVTSAKGTPQFQFKLEITESAYAGAVRTTWINTNPSDPNDRKRVESHLYVWGKALLSIGISADDLKGAQIQHEKIPTIFTGRDCFVEVTERAKMDGTMIQQVSFLKPAAYALKRAAQDAAGGPAVAAPTPAPTPVAVSAPTGLSMPTAPAAAPAPVSNGITAPAAPAPQSAGLAALLGR